MHFSLRKHVQYSGHPGQTGLQFSTPDRLLKKHLSRNTHKHLLMCRRAVDNQTSQVKV